MINIIVATSINGVIGKDNKLPWGRIKEDMGHFKFITSQSTVVMGRKTYESIGKPLSNRRNIVLSNSIDSIDGAEVINNIDTIIEMDKRDPLNDIFIIGGENVYKQFMEYADRIFLTVVNETFEGDTFFKIDNLSEWEDIYEKTLKSDKYSLTFMIKDRKKSGKLS